MSKIRGEAKEMAFLYGWPQVAQDAIFGIASREVLMTYKSFSGRSKTN